ncbi:T9SS type A sorting domain-containing protein [Chryseobacterium sp. Tr-659]|uniref:T9SS type A sorting domain-containing protein n=1 Tax=Chryseobacterium sp. Tr-659 TaxID=2608340 RepID=UPI00141E274E|nr:T9SS type A sorting domain-containing protein [Chryseobacterium sp. Tr-659]NIF04039.1 T9SS type A sorting domain-containing protein [Chryseobacterium sp. Tr-659]
MKRYLLLILLGFYMNTFSQNNPEKILFIGNSMTYFNNMPEIFAGIAQSKGKTVETVQHTPGGTGFVDHVNNNDLYMIIRNTIFDKVVMQPGTGESGGASFPVSITAQRGNRIKDSIKKYSPCAQIFLYEISNGIAASNAYPNYFLTQQKIRDSIHKMSGLMQIPMVPAGEAAKKHYQVAQDLRLHSSYGDVHPNLNGSYLIASAIYASIYQENASQSTHLAGIPQADAAYFQGIADDVVLNHINDWNLSSFNLFSNFSYNIGGLDVNFQNQSVNFSNVVWDFGDGTSSVLQNPAHQYSAPGTYNVKLSAFSGNCQITKIKQIAVSQLAVNEPNDKKLKIYPNPAAEFFTIESKEQILAMEIYTASGNLLMKKKDIRSKYCQENVSSYRPGVYFVKILLENSGWIHYKLIKD